MSLWDLYGDALLSWGSHSSTNLINAGDSWDDVEECFNENVTTARFIILATACAATWLRHKPTRYSC